MKRLLAALVLATLVVTPSICSAEDTAVLQARADSLETLRADLQRQLAEVEGSLEALQSRIAELELSAAEREGGIYTTLAMLGRLRSQPSSKGEPVAELPKGSVVQILGYPKATYWRVRAGGVDGYLGTLYLEVNDEMRQMRADFDYEQLSPAERSRREMLLDTYGDSLGARLIKRELWIGMTLEMLWDSRGIPSSTTSTTTATELHGQICYGEPLPKLCVYLVNNVVTSWQRFTN